VDPRVERNHLDPDHDRIVSRAMARKMRESLRQPSLAGLGRPHRGRGAMLDRSTVAVRPDIYLPTDHW
jgi:hypothetical protein